MDGRTLGFVAARGLSAFFIVSAVEKVAANYTFIAQSHLPDDTSARWLTLAAYAAPLAYLIAAVALWFGAKRFCPADEPSESESLTVRSAVGLTMTGIGIFVLVAHMGGLVGFIWQALEQHSFESTRTVYWEDLASCLLAVCLIVIGRQNLLTIATAQVEATERAEP